MVLVQWGTQGKSRGLRWILLLIASLAAGSGSLAAAPLSERERTFLRFVFEGDETKVVEYAQVAGINVNSIAGEPLSVWFYRDGRTPSGQVVTRSVAVQRIVFERFKQNPNPPNLGEANALERFCEYAPSRKNIQLESNGTPEQLRTYAEGQAADRKPHVEAMGAGFQSLLRYGLKDRKLITKIFEGCVFRNGARIDVFVYDTVLAPMVKAGADINMETTGGQRPIAHAMAQFNVPLVYRLVRDRADVKYPLRESGFDKVDPAEPCQPRRYRSLYKYIFERVRPRGVDAMTPVLQMIKVLGDAGLSPMTKYGYIEKQNDGRQVCRYASFYDAVVDTGNLEFARLVKDAAAAPAAATSAPAQQTKPQHQATLPPADTPPPTQIGAWRIAIKPDGRPQAITKSNKTGANELAGLQVECVAGGRLEYVPAALKLTSLRSLWLHSSDDTRELRLVNGRASGPSAATLSKELLQAEAEAKKNGAGDDFALALGIDDANAAPAMVQMAGFGQMRAFMLSRCKN